jgi:hypothetical protein
LGVPLSATEVAALTTRLAGAVAAVKVNMLPLPTSDHSSHFAGGQNAVEFAARMVKKLVRTPPCAKYTLFRQIL